MGGFKLNGKYLTVAEFAEKAGVSKQTIYDQMTEGKRLAPYKKKINGKKMIRSDALSYYTSDSERTPETETVSSPPPAADPDDISSQASYMPKLSLRS